MINLCLLLIRAGTLEPRGFTNCLRPALPDIMEPSLAQQTQGAEIMLDHRRRRPASSKSTLAQHTVIMAESVDRRWQFARTTPGVRMPE